ncbi:PTS sugar transporter subunit IIB [Tepidimicrobium xylanilyticum]|uniref:PTS system IIB component, L-Asc family (TC 4.A.7) n=1 Tax=Tepidimicrobium xylanilyticum TaxID=1123352 RepID=A0A1H2RPA2_9FIRM|nr:PTS sugar transporter subunit IIB [Tepidimicrobium xylanilyticum]GMG95369.1 PTS ascorbate transporter subunit IIB [Tepidimicrobium xylanilyticum]SDW21177.1 PTS system IIB component, L-Asc family (TC 4.A.7) [Tepidimicrobium xylanilyticum]
MRILVSCANGAGTSLMMKMKVQQALKELGIEIREIRHCSISEGKSAAKNYDVVFCSANFVDMFKDAEAKGVKIIGMKNILSVEEAKDRLKEAGLC